MRRMPYLALTFVLLTNMACQEEPSLADASPPPDGPSVQDGAHDTTDIQEPDCPFTLQVKETGIEASWGCGESSLNLLPFALVDGLWQGPNDVSSCVVEAQRIECPAGDAGRVFAEIVDDSLVAGLVASRVLRVEGISLDGQATLPGATAWLSNGFQSWSQSGMVALGPEPTQDQLERALAARGDQEVMRTGAELSWYYTIVGGGGPVLLAGALSAGRWRPWVQVSQGEALAVRLVSGGAGESVPLAAGATARGEAWRVELGEDGHALLAAYGRALPSRRPSHPAPAEGGWNSWYELWDHVDEEAVRANADLVQGILGPYLPPTAPLRIVIDDGWQRAWGDWEPNEKFPLGLDGLALDLKSQGFEVGVWLAPLLVDQDSELAATHPDWFVQGVEYLHALEGKMFILDPTHPEAAEHLGQVIARLVSWGLDLLKIDFLFTGTFEGVRSQDVTPMEAYTFALETIRQAAGESTILLAVGSPGHPTFPYVDAWRLGGDIALQLIGPSWPFIMNQARSVAARWPLCHATLCDADPPLLRDLPHEEVTSGVWVAALAGGAMFLSDDLRSLEEERTTWGLEDIPFGVALGGEPSQPEELFPPDPPATLSNAMGDLLDHRNSHIVPTRWLLPDGSRVGLNSGEAEITVEGVIIPPRSTRLLP